MSNRDLRADGTGRVVEAVAVTGLSAQAREALAKASDLRYWDEWLSGSYPRAVVPVLASGVLELEAENERLREALRGLASPALIETLAEAAHDAWMSAHIGWGITSRTAPWGEEFMVPYAQLSERGKELDRVIMRAVIAALEGSST